MHKDEVAYPFLPETSALCDWEIYTDMLYSQVAVAAECLEESAAELLQDLRTLQELIYHMNGSVRGRYAVVDADLAWLHSLYQELQAGNPLPPEYALLPSSMWQGAKPSRFPISSCWRWKWTSALSRPKSPL